MVHKITARKTIKLDSSWTWLWILLLLLCSVASLVFLYDYVITRETVSQVTKLNHQLTEQQHRIQTLEQARSALSKKLALVESSAQVDRAAVDDIKKDTQKYQDERAVLEEELVLLRGLISEGKNHLLIRDIRLMDARKANAYLYKVTVARSVKGDEPIEGQVALTVRGVLNGKKTVLSLQEITPKKAKYLRMRFKYFQVLEGEIRLPEGFEPKSFQVKVKPKGDDANSVNRRFNWIITQN